MSTLAAKGHGLATRSSCYTHQAPSARNLRKVLPQHSRQKVTKCFVTTHASWSPPSDPDSTPNTPPEFTPPSDPSRPYQPPPPEFTPPDRPPNEEPRRGDPPLRPIRPDQEPGIPDPDSPNADPVRTPERRKEITEPPQRENPDSRPERE